MARKRLPHEVAIDIRKPEEIAEFGEGDAEALVETAGSSGNADAHRWRPFPLRPEGLVLSSLIAVGELEWTGPRPGKGGDALVDRFSSDLAGYPQP